MFGQQRPTDVLIEVVLKVFAEISQPAFQYLRLVAAQSWNIIKLQLQLMGLFTGQQPTNSSAFYTGQNNVLHAANQPKLSKLRRVICNAWCINTKIITN